MIKKYIKIENVRTELLCSLNPLFGVSYFMQDGDPAIVEQGERGLWERDWGPWGLGVRVRKSAMKLPSHSWEPIVALHFDHVLVGITSFSAARGTEEKMADIEGGWCCGKSSFKLKLAH